MNQLMPYQLQDSLCQYTYTNWMPTGQSSIGKEAMSPNHFLNENRRWRSGNPVSCHYESTDVLQAPGFVGVNIRTPTEGFLYLLNNLASVREL